MSAFIVTGQRFNGTGWEDFTSSHDADSQAQARWAARRAHAPGEPACDLEATPPNSEREAVEIDAPDEDPGDGVSFWHPRAEARTAAERAEYDRLVQTVRIFTVEAE